MSRAVWPVFAALVACEDPVDELAEVRSTCDMSPSAPLGAWWSSDGSGPDTISEACAIRLGEELKLDWDLFHQEPTTIGNPDTTAQVLIWAAYTLFASDVGDLAELDAALVDDELLRKEYGDRFLGMGATDEATALWRRHYRDHVVYLGWFERDDCTMFFDDDRPSVHNVFVCSDISREDPLRVAAMLLHEAGHNRGPPHVSNTWGFGTDLDYRGTYGLQARWYHSWFQHYDGLSELDPNSVIGSYCVEHMLDSSGFPPCGPFL